MTKYKLVGRCLDGVRVEGYIVQELKTGRTVFAPKDTVDKLALSRQIENCVTQKYNGEIKIKGKGCKIVNLPLCDKNGRLIGRDNKVKEKEKGDWEIVGRIMNKQRTLGYRLRYNDGYNMKVTDKRRDDVILMAKHKLISNARVQLSKGESILRGVGCELTQLPTYRVV